MALTILDRQKVKLPNNLGRWLSAIDLEKVGELLTEKDQVIDVTPPEYGSYDQLGDAEMIETHDQQVYGVMGRLERMKEMIEEAKISPRIRQLVGRIVRSCPERNQMCEMKAIHNYIAEKTRFLEDTRDIEVFAEPEITLSFGAGDCDDLTILSSALLESAGFKTQLVAVGQNEYEHVFLRADYPKPPAAKVKTIAFDLSVPNKQFNFDPTTVENFNKIKIVDID